MRQNVSPGGYTMVEVMIFLAVSAAIFFSAAALFSGRIQRTQFSQAVRELDQQLHGMVNDVASGFYPNTGDFSCRTNPAGAPILTKVAVGAGTEQGTNTGCIFLGKVIQFAQQNNPTCPASPDPNTSVCDRADIFSVVGRQQVRVGSVMQDVSSLSAAIPTAINPSTARPANPNATQALTLGYGLHVTAVFSMAGATTTPIGAFGFFQPIGADATTGSNPVSGSQAVAIVPVMGSTLGQTTTSMATSIGSVSDTDANPSGGILVCLKSGGTEDRAAITIGTQNKQIGTDVILDEGDIPAACPS